MIAVHVVAGMAWRIPQVASMDGALTAEDVRLLSAWALGVEGDSSEDLQLLLAVPGEELQLQGASEAPKRKKQRSTYLRTRVRCSRLVFQRCNPRFSIGFVFWVLQEAKAGLKDEIAALEARLEALKGRAGLGSGDRANVQQTAVQNAVLRGVAHQQHMKMAGTHSALVARLVSLLWLTRVGRETLTRVVLFRICRRRTRCTRRCIWARTGSLAARLWWP